jgi:acetyltransferase-like isoleucine patch superfamily enzyme
VHHQRRHAVLPEVRWSGRAVGRITWVVVSVLAVQGFVCGIALLPVVLLWSRLLDLTASSGLVRAAAISFALVPSYVLFALILMFASALVTRAVGWRTPESAAMSIAELDWPLLRWVRSMVAIHLVRLVAGALLRGSPVWTAYLRLAGARLGRRVYVNSLSVSDYNLLDFGDGVVIGEHVHLSGHTVEDGVVKTGAIRLGRNVTIGLGSVVEIGVVADDGCQVGALSFVPKYARLEGGRVYVGIPARPVD